MCSLPPLPPDTGLEDSLVDHNAPPGTFRFILQGEQEGCRCVLTL